MQVKIADLMTSDVVSAKPDDSIEQVRSLMELARVHALPVLDGEDHPVGIVSSADFLSAPSGARPVREVMSEHVYTVPQYNDVHVAARVMRNHRIHHVVVTHEKKVVGVISSFDLLLLVEEHRFVMKDAPRDSPRRTAKRGKYR